MENYNTEAVISARDNGFTSTINSVLSSLKNLEGASESAVKSVESCADAISGLMGSVGGLGDLQELCSAMKTFGNVTKTAFQQREKFAGKMDAVKKLKKDIIDSVAELKGLKSEAEKTSKGAQKSKETSAKKNEDEIGEAKNPISALKSKGASAKKRVESMGDKVGEASFIFGSATGRFSKDPPTAWKKIDKIRNEGVLNSLGNKVGEASFKFGSATGRFSPEPPAAWKKIDKIRDLGVSNILGDKITEAIYAFQAVTGKFDGSAMWKGIDLLSEKVSNMPQMIKKIGPAFQAASKLGEAAMMGLTPIMGAALKTIGPAAIIGAAIAGLGLLQGQFGDQINGLLQIAVEQGPQIIQNLVDGIVNSLPAFMAAGSELLVNLLDAITANLPVVVQGGIQIISSLVQGLIDNLPQIIPAALNMLTTLIEAIVTNLPTLVQMGLLLIVALITGIVDNLPQIITSGIALIMTLIAGIGSMIPDILAAGWEIIKALGMGIIKAIPEILTWAIDGIKDLFSDLWDFITGKNEEGVDKTSEKMEELATGLTDKTYGATTQAKVDFEILNTEGSANIDNLLQNVGNLGDTMQTVPVEGMAVMQQQCGESVTTMENDVSEGMNKIVDSTTLAMESFGQAIQAGMTDAQSKVTTGVDGITAVFTPLRQKLYSIGIDVMAGLSNGIYASANSVYAAAETVANGIARIMEDALKVGSPSKVTTKIGEYAGIGPAIGMLNMLPKVEKASARLAEAMQPVVTSDFLGAGRYGSGSGRISVSAEGQAMTNAYLRMVLNDIREAVCEQGNKTYVFEAPLNLEGKQIAKASAVYTQEEINRKEKLLKRMGGYR